MPGPRDYTTVTRTALAALSKGTCYYPNCQRPVVVLVEEEPFVDCQIAHIADAKPGNRYVPNMDDDDRRAFTNLIFLCKPHHDLVDKRHPERFTADDLRRWKRERESPAVLRGDPTAMTDDVIEDALAYITNITIESGGLHLGGAGGAAIGAGGGGGGVIGPGTGGPGGPGGTIQVPDEQRIDLAGRPGQAPGAGGGGAGLLLPGTMVRQPAPGEGSEGRGYSTGLDGPPGQSSSFGDPSSAIFVEAKGGNGTLAGNGPRLPSDTLGLSSLTLVNSVETRGGLLYILGGGWQNFEVLNLGDSLGLCVVLVFEAGGLEPGDYTAKVAVQDPEGANASSVTFPVTVEEAGDLVRVPRVVVLDIEVSAFGIWRLAVSNDAQMIGCIDLMIKRRGVETVPPH